MTGTPPTTDETDRRTVPTRDGAHYSRFAADGAFCYRHARSDGTVDDVVAADGGTETTGDGRASGDDDPETETESDSGDTPTAVEELEALLRATSDETASERAGDVERTTDVAAESDEGSEEIDDEAVDLVDVRRTVAAVASDLIGHPLDGVSEIRSREDGWLAVVEVVERPAVPDTQDILGSYETELGPDGTIRSYHRVDRYRRSDTANRE